MMEVVRSTGPVQSGNIPGQRSRGLTRDVIEKLQRAIEYARIARDKHITAFIGPTGTGKSTIVNHMLGRTLVPIRITGAGRRLEVDGPPVARISHSGTESETLFAQTYPIPGRQDAALVDCGGFWDSRGVSSEVAVVTSTKLTLENAASAKLALCCQHASLSLDRATHLARMVKTLLSDVLNSNQSYNSMVVLITRPVMQDIDHPPTTESVIEELEYLREGTRDEELRRIFDFILREDGRYVLLYDPLNTQCRDQLNELLNQIAPIPANSFNPTYSAEASLAVFEEMVTIAGKGNRLFNELILKREAIVATDAALAQLAVRTDRFRGLIAQLNQGNNIDPAVLRQQRETLKGEQQTVIDNSDVDIGRLRGRIQTENVNKTASSERLRIITQRDEEEGLLWEDKIDQEGKKIAYIAETVKKKKSKFGGVGGGLIGGALGGGIGAVIGAVAGELVPTGVQLKSGQEIRYMDIPTEKEFKYPKDHPILRLEKEPDNGACWSNEQGGPANNHYSISYKTEPGAPAKAAIRIFGHRKHMPEVVNEKISIQQRLHLLGMQINQLNIDIQVQENAKNAASITVNNINNSLDNLTFYENQIQEIEGERRDIQARKDQLEQRKNELIAEIERERVNFQFMMDYKSLTRDGRLNRNDIQECITKYRSYEGLPNA